jgi:D-glycerate 3-kinase
LGFEPQEESVVTAVDPQLAPVNKQLAAYYDAWHKLVDSWIVIQVDDPHWVFRWRLQAEIATRAGGKAGMTDEQVADFVSRYMPAYKAYLPALYGQGPKGAREEHMLLLLIDENRNPVG